MLEKEFKITFPLDISEIRAISSSMICGRVQLVNGSASVTDPRISTDALPILSRGTTGGTLGHLYATISGNTVTIQSTSSSETSTVYYWIIPYAIVSR